MTDLDVARTGTPVGRSFLRRHAALIVATTALVAAGAFTYASLATPVYTAHARVLVEPLTLPTAVQRTPDMGTEAAITTSSAVLSGAAAQLRLSLNTVDDAVSVTVPPAANVLDVAYSASDPLVARNGATAVARAYMRYRTRTTDAKAGNRLAAPGVQTRLVTPAARPASPSSPDVVVDVLAGIVVGLVLAGALAFGIDRFGRRIHTPARWQEMTGVPVVAGLQDRSSEDRPDPTRPEVLRYLRARVGHALPTQSAVLLVIGVGEQPQEAEVARPLADAFADAGRGGVLIEIAEDEGTLRVRTTFPSAPGHGARPAGDWRPTTIADALADIDDLRAEHDLLVVTAPPSSVSATALDVAAVADAALLVDHVSASRRDRAVRAVAELRGTGCGVSGCVLLGLRTSRPGDAAQADVRVVRERPATRARPRPSGRTGPPVQPIPVQPIPIEIPLDHQPLVRTGTVNGSKP